MGKGNRFVLSLEASSGLRFVVGNGKRLHQSWARLVLKKRTLAQDKSFYLANLLLPPWFELASQDQDQQFRQKLCLKIRRPIGQMNYSGRDIYSTTHCMCIFRVSYTMCPPEARLETSTRWPKWLQNLKATSFGSTYLNHLNMLLHLWWISLNYHGDF